MKRSAILFSFLGLFLVVGLCKAGATCTLSQQCPNGGSISCTGPTGTCTSNSDSITCNGTIYKCPTPCSASLQCSYGGFIECWTPNGSCEAGADYVTCTGTGTLTCDACYPAIQCQIP
jgi:hypothetical protein